jgi:methionyl-tRNA formyltransferase
VIRVAYFGLPLGALLLANDGIEFSLVVLSPMEAPGRRRLGRVVRAPIVDARASTSAEFLSAVDEKMAELAPDLVVSWYFTRRVERRWLGRARFGGIGAHPSLLPRHRGPNPFFAAIDSGDATTGVTIHALTDAYDEGDVLSTEELAIGERDSWQLARALDRPSLRLLRRAVRDIAAGTAPERRPQDEAAATWAGDPEGDQLRADFRWSTERVLRRVRALAPVPGLGLEIRGVELLVTRAEPARSFPIALIPGEAHAGPDGVVIRTGDGAILITRAAIVDGESGDARELGRTAIAELVREPAPAPYAETS